MSSYIFVSPRSDPGMGRPLDDPILRAGVRPTMGTCRPDLRRLVRLGDQIFVVSGSMGPAIKQYVIGGLEIGQNVPGSTRRLHLRAEARRGSADVRRRWPLGRA